MNRTGQFSRNVHPLRRHGSPGEANWRSAPRAEPGWRVLIARLASQKQDRHPSPGNDQIADSVRHTEQDVTPMGRLEAVLFAARQPLSLRKLAQLAELEDGTQARTLIRQLQSSYLARDAAFLVEMVAGGYQLFTRKALAPWLRRAIRGETGPNLSVPAMETLSVVAYCQPILRAELESIRGVGCGELLRQLMDRGLLRIVGRSQELGRPFLYGTTIRFLQEFGLRNLDDLPQAKRLRKQGSGSKTG